MRAWTFILNDKSIIKEKELALCEKVIVSQT